MTRRLWIIPSVLFGLSAWSNPLAAKDQCVVCHATLGEGHQAILKSFSNDIHREKGLSCHSCHGGDPAAEDAGQAMAPEAGFRGAPSKLETPRFCGRCHSDPSYMKRFNPALPVDQEAKYLTSMHGRKLKTGDTKVAACTSCHPAHSIRPAKDPTSSVYAKNVPHTCGRCHADEKLMARYNLPADQIDKYSRSVHGKALLEKGDTGAPACNTCHGNHGAVPPGVENIGHICGMCHGNNEELFKTSPMAKAWERRKFHICATCHGHHDIQHPTVDLLSTKQGLCRRCHLPSSRAFEVADGMKTSLERVEDAYRDAEQVVSRAEQRGMDMAEAHDALNEAKMAMYQAKTMVHTFHPEKVAEIAGKGIKISEEGAKKVALEALREFNYRRAGLGVATLLLALLVVAIYFKLKDIEQGRKQDR